MSKQKWIVTVVVVVTVVLLVIGGTALYAKTQNDQAPDALTLSTAEPTSAASADSGATGTTTDLTGDWTVSDGSAAGYRVAEVLNGQDVTVVGRTPDVSGTVTVDGTDVTTADVTVDMTTITTDSSSRDGKFLSILSTDTFPTATFTLTSPMDVSAIVDGVASVEGTGDLTVAGVTQSVSVAFEAQSTEDGVEVSGSIPVDFADYGVDAPDLGFVKVESSGTVEMLLVLTR
ncbi:YceI family protein [Sanguibacter antarcticus]|uniref:Polyisoprenoid-binding protein YceI n=1 Tax=Sanguibacter antarcticus TaxID=372484 RepID=A0A2A9E6I5_9MICO|nr:YceI family protein [Sanguibacter antarcticus]PFG33945.1 polyisoprenoid-binding protein YceI [Sanguibacter antarcticus]